MKSIFKIMSFREKKNGKQLLLTLQNTGKNKWSHQVGRLKQTKGGTVSQHIIKLWLPSYYMKLDKLMEARATNAISIQRYQLLARKPPSPIEYWGIITINVTYCSSLGIFHRALSEQGTEPHSTPALRQCSQFCLCFRGLKLNLYQVSVRS